MKSTSSGGRSRGTSTGGIGIERALSLLNKQPFSSTRRGRRRRSNRGIVIDRISVNKIQRLIIHKLLLLDERNLLMNRIGAGENRVVDELTLQDDLVH